MGIRAHAEGCQGEQVTATTERRASVPPLRFDWSRVRNPAGGYLLAGKWIEVAAIYTTSPHPSVSLNAWKIGNQAWKWLACAVVDAQPVILKNGTAGSLERAKIAAELAVYKLNLSRAQLTVWDAVAAVDADPVPF